MGDLSYGVRAGDGVFVTMGHPGCADGVGPGLGVPGGMAVGVPWVGMVVGGTNWVGVGARVSVGCRGGRRRGSPIGVGEGSIWRGRGVLRARVGVGVVPGGVVIVRTAAMPTQ